MVGTVCFTTRNVYGYLGFFYCECCHSNDPGATSCKYNTNTIHSGILRTVLCCIIDWRSSFRRLARKKKDVPCRHGDIYCSLGLIAGQIIGGTLLHFDLWGLGWRAVFLINLPIGILAMLMIIPLLKETPSNGNQKIDVRGIIILTCGLLLLVYPLVVGREAGWPLWIYLSFVGAIALFFLYQFHEKRMTLRGDEPLIRVNIFKERTFTLGVFTILAYQIGNSGFFLVVSMTLQDALSLSAIDSAIAFIPIGFAFFIASLLGPNLAKTNASVLKWGATLLIAGYAAVMQCVLITGTICIGSS